MDVHHSLLGTSNSHLTQSSGRFSITVVNHENEKDVVIQTLDNVVTNIIDNYRDANYPLSIEFNANVPTLVTIKNKTAFNKLFKTSIEVLNKFDVNSVEFKIQNNEFDNVLNLIEDKCKLKENILNWGGGNLFYMFPSCVGFAFMQYYDSLLRFDAPHELLCIDSDTLKKYIKDKLV